MLENSQLDMQRETWTVINSDLVEVPIGKLDISGRSDYYWARWFGSSEQIDGTQHGPDIYTAMQVMMDNRGLKVSGSATEGAVNPNVKINISNYSPVRKFIDPIWDRPSIHDPKKNQEQFNTLINTPLHDYMTGLVSPESMQPEEYAARHIFLNLLPNLDFHFYDNLNLGNNGPDTNKILMSVLRYADMVGNMGAARWIARIGYYGRFERIVLWGDDFPGGVNVMALPQKHQETYTTTVSRRADGQTAVLKMEAGDWVAQVNIDALNHGQVSMLIKPERLDKYYQQASRTVRMMVLNQVDEARLDVDSFINNLTLLNTEIGAPVEPSYNLESALSVFTNLFTSFSHEVITTGDAAKTKMLMESLGLFNPAKLDLFHNLVAKVKQINDPSSDQPASEILLSNLPSPEIKSWLDFLTAANQQIYGNLAPKTPSNLDLFPVNYNPNSQLRHLTDFAPFLALFMPVTCEQFKSIIPIPENREKVTAEISGNNAADQGTNPDAVKNYGTADKPIWGIAIDVDAAIAFNQLADIASNRGDDPEIIKNLRAGAQKAFHSGVLFFQNGDSHQNNESLMTHDYVVSQINSVTRHLENLPEHYPEFFAQYYQDQKTRLQLLLPSLIDNKPLTINDLSIQSF